MDKKSNNFEEHHENVADNLPTDCCRGRKPSTGYNRGRIEQSFYALIEQFWFVHRRHSHYPASHDIDFVLPNLKFKAD